LELVTLRVLKQSYHKRKDRVKFSGWFEYNNTGGA